MEHNDQKSREPGTAGIFFLAGGGALLLVFGLMLFGLASVELPDQKIDLPSLLLSIASWLLLLGGFSILFRVNFLHARNYLLWVPMIGLCVYVAGCLVILFEFWNLILIVPIGLLLTAIGTLLVGVASFRLRIAAASTSLGIILAGLYPFLCMFPVVAIYGSPNYMVNYLWGAPWAIVGLLLIKQQRASRTRG